MDARRYHVTTFGCQMNEHDSERLKGMLDGLGYEECSSRAEAELILFNTCSIRESADNRFIAHLGEAKRLKGEDPARIVGVGGCWAQSVKDEVFERFPFVDVAFGPGQIHKLAEFLTSDSLTAQGFFEFEELSGHLPMKRERQFQAWVQISQGCNCVCAYCIVPSTRGREVSRAPDELVAEISGLAADGVREVTLLGQNVNSYGRDLPRERRIRFRQARRARNLGLVVICDRFPQAQLPGLNDGPWLGHWMRHRSWIRRAAARSELAAIRLGELQAPDLVVKLHVPIDTALGRRPNIPGEQLARKAEEVAALLRVPVAYPYRHRHQLGGVKVGKYLRFPESAVRRRLERPR